MRPWRTALCCLVAAAAVGSLHGCSKEALKRTGYETLHNISDSKNDGDPRYESERTDFETYQRRREEVLPDQRPGEIVPPVSPDPVAP
jgi:hypothetical protein